MVLIAIKIFRLKLDSKPLNSISNERRQLILLKQTPTKHVKPNAPTLKTKHKRQTKINSKQ